MSYPGTILVTGGGSGIGRATAVKFSSLGYKCAVCDINEVSAQETVALLHGTGHIAIHVDVADPQSVKTMVQIATEQLGGCINVAFNNAGIEGARGKTHLYPLDAFERVVAVNLTGTWLCMKYEIEQMLKQQLVIRDAAKWENTPAACKHAGVRGSIVNASSTAGLDAMAEFSPYCASKWGILGITKTAAVEYAKEGIRINAVCPSTTFTPMRDRFQRQWPEWQAEADAAHPAGRIATAEEVAEAVAWLASDLCPFVTGEYIKIAGGC